MGAKRQSWFRTRAFWVWWSAMSVLVLAATCTDVQGPTVVEPADDTTESDTMDSQGFLGPDYVKRALA